jgi:hypothetical protein
MADYVVTTLVCEECRAEADAEGAGEQLRARSLDHRDGLLTGLYPVVIRGASIDKTGIAIAMNVLVRNTAVVVGLALQVARRPRANGLYASDGS